MRERFETLFRLDRGLYTAGAPLLITAGALLRDSYADDLLCQLKFRNNSSRTVRAIQVRVSMRDINGHSLGQAVEHRYVDLMLKRDEEYGQRCAIVLPDPETRSFSVQLTEVSFLDGGTWQPGHMPWVKLKKPQTLEEHFGDPGLAEEFRLRYGADCRYATMVDGELWLCTCGTYNHIDEPRCHRCHRPRSALKEVNLQALTRAYSDRSRSEAAREEREREEEEAEKKRKRSRLLIGVPAALLALLMLILIPWNLQRSRQYEMARTMAESGRLEDARQIYSALGSYRDSREQLEKGLPYLEAAELAERAAANDGTALKRIGLAYSDLEEGTTPAMLLYQAAAEQFRALGEYEDSAERAKECEKALEACREDRRREEYETARTLLEQGSFSKAREMFLALGEYEDSGDLAKECVYRKATGLLKALEKYDLSQVHAALSMDSDGTSVFSLSKERALELGSQSVGDLRLACGEDFVDIRLEEEPDPALSPLGEEVMALLASLDGYRDSGELSLPQPPQPEPEPEPEPTETFFALLESGQLQEAGEWLAQFSGELDYREEWAETIEKYKAFCGDWTIYAGDPTLLPLTQGHSEACYHFNSRVLIQGNTATLRLTGRDDTEFTVDLTAELGETSFHRPADPYHYLAAISTTGRMGYMMYDGNGRLRSSCEYQPAQ